MQILRNPHVLAGGPRAFHRLVPGYSPTTLVDASAIAERLGLGRVLVKHEVERFGLPSFKIIGASWATYRALCQELGRAPDISDPSFTFESLRDEFASLGGLTLVTATDGNHGRAVARVAKWFGFKADIYVPIDTVPARIAAIESEGATVTVVPADYDEAVRTAATTAEGDASRLVISDTSWPGYTDVPQWISHGYSTIFQEVDEAMDANNWGRPDAIVVPVGVGAFALAALQHAPWAGPGSDKATSIAVEPSAADSLYKSLIAGHAVTVPGPHESMMAGMNCGTLSMLAWPVMRDLFDWCITIEDSFAADAMRSAAASGMVIGETGAATIGALLAIDASTTTSLADLGLGPDSTVVCFATEGATDPANYEVIVGTPPPIR